MAPSAAGLDHPTMCSRGLIIALLVAVPTVASGQRVSFDTRNDYSTGTVPIAVTMADLDRDGRLDLAVANSNSQSLSVLLGSPDRTFAATHHPVSGSPQAIAVADLNADTRPDLVAVAIGANAASVLLSQAAGGFGGPVDYPVGLSPLGVAVGDLNRDGDLDLAVANASSGTVSLLFGSGDGAFAPALALATAAGPHAVAIADFDRDGSLDVAVACRSASVVSVVRGNGDGTFAPRADLATGSQPVSIAVGDLNADGVLDLALADRGPAHSPAASVSVLLGTANGTFQSRVGYATDPGPESVTIGDLDGDHRPVLGMRAAAGVYVIELRSAAGRLSRRLAIVP